MNSLSKTSLIAALNAEHAALLGFVALLEQEREKLVGNIDNELLDLSAQKSAAALNLNQLAQTSHALLQQTAPPLHAETITDWLRIHSAEGWKIWQEIRTLASRSQQLNRMNGKLIQMKLRTNQNLLAALNSALNKASLYGPNGQASLANNGGRSLGSA
jgi:flagellar biosynthesis/type III secretory pathway chaperone